MPTLRHTLISASAGSGKTYQLVQRYLQLLAFGVEPTRIAAMTFTRKAAGEFINRILISLADMAENPQKAAAFVHQLEPMPTNAVDFLGRLKEVLRALPRLRLGTLDSFFASVTTCFPLELGLPVGASVMDEDEARMASRQALESLLSSLYRERDEQGTRTLLEAFKQATFGHEEKKILPTLEDWIKRGHEIWQECPESERWGLPSAIWPHPEHRHAAVWQVDRAIDEILDELVQSFSTEALSPRALDAWEKIQEQIRAHEFGLKPGTQLAAFLEKLVPLAEGLRKGEAEFKYHFSTWRFSDRSAQAALLLVMGLLGRELLIRCERTRGIQQVVAAYEAEYDRSVRRRGRLSFADLTRLVAGVAGAPWTIGGDKSAELWYRLDSRIDHWLFDEFQDTSAQQWAIMRELVDEVIQDADQQRTFFAVGDVKQSIYLWRRAEAEIFSRVLSEYPDRGGLGIEKRCLATSYRSCDEVLRMVNQVFGERPRLASLLGDGCLRHWDFELHSADSKERGFSAFLQPAASQEIDGPSTLLDATAALLNEVQPASRGLTCAVLVRSNHHATQVVEHLRATTDMDVTSQSEEHPAEDNPVNAALLAVLQLAAHPGDTLALEHLRMTPLAPRFDRQAPWRSELEQTLQLIHRSGMAEALEAWAGGIQSPLDEFSSRRVQQLLNIATEFDESGSRNVDDFLRFARSYGSRSGDATLAVQVMTVHKSKGLEFDMVIVPLLDNSGLTTLSRLDLVVRRQGLDAADWVLQYPPAPYDALDAVLSDQKEKMSEDEGFESLCGLYVAMTRAKRALYIIAPPAPKNSASVNAARLLRETLMNSTAELKPASDAEPPRLERLGEADIEWLRTFGNHRWFESRAVSITSSASPTREGEPKETLGDLLRHHQQLPRRRTPSGEESFTLPGHLLFSSAREQGRQFGTLIHAMMEQIEWLDPYRDIDEAEVLSLWQAKHLLDSDAADDANMQALSVLRSAECRPAFFKPSPRALVWRERSFDLILPDGDWVSGTLDRVVVDYDSSGRAVSASIFDFKTDDIADQAAMTAKLAGYKPQIALYRSAVMRLTGLPDSKVRAALLFTRVGKLVAID